MKHSADNKIVTANSWVIGESVVRAAASDYSNKFKSNLESLVQVVYSYISYNNIQRHSKFHEYTTAKESYK